MKYTALLFTCSLLFCVAVKAGNGIDTAIVLPLGGNTWAVNAPSNANMITNAGIENWVSKETQFNTYLRINKSGVLKLAIKARTDNESKLQIGINGELKIVMIKGHNFQLYEAGEWKLKDTGYIKITLQGLTKSGEHFADVSDYAISGTVINAETVYTKNNEGKFFYWGRRGPSVHLNYAFADSVKAQWFYNEVTFPKGEDVIGTYAMACGFGQGYFGMQVNSETERRILFSVWSPFTTNDPKNIPADERIVLLKKGAEVNAQDFGNEGSGGQSFMPYNWKAGTTYKFLLKGEPDGQNNTIYTAYFFSPEKNEWLLMASFKRPKTNTYLKRFHSFLENFNPNQGDKARKVLYGNQWICDNNGKWIELNKASFTYDNTARIGYRMDYTGGTEKGQFFLKNCGFFNKYTTYKTLFERPAKQVAPAIDLNKLP
ncbi:MULTISPECIES: DUF3472 domain-containing protein [Niastella]|uniref:DUF3472 domain-containing protein n=1 Tax=Niastella soli TaxID=2821487 RepID=A0ABS3Z160_9BACT|nr:DUF3472 domain-containing protein [Niastella soli]MBO9203895.1 DUF3472 domain-containing protein [Niastella soli]